MTRGPKKQAGAREPNGQLSRRLEDVAKRLAQHMRDLDVEERRTMAPGIDARMRLWDLSIEDARTADAGSFVGRLRMSGELTPPQYEAAMSWLTDVENYRWAVGGPKQPNAMNLNRVIGLPTDGDNFERARRYEDRYRDASKAVMNAQIELRGACNLFGALDAILIRDMDLMHLVPDLKLALNALDRHYKALAKKLAKSPETVA
jgi:hypothetical protein